MSETLPAIQEKAVSLRDYLFSDNVKPVLESAIPKWLSIDRLLRVVFSATMKNPRLLDCTRESLLQSVMQCCQLGLEPVLGRAYLIPYNNSKYVNGKWVKVLECQMQVGYQGFVDLGRRTGDVADIWGENVYENDEFDLRHGMERALHHRPWFMDPEKRKAGKGGDIIGAYVVWQFKDGTKHPHFMPIHDIHKRRAKSQAYRFAETGEPGKGGGKQDSIWHEWPEEQNLKTVIKHSSKLVPMSIEFMQAVELDNMHEIGAGDIERGFMLPGIPKKAELTNDAQSKLDELKKRHTEDTKSPAGHEQGDEMLKDIGDEYLKQDIPPGGPPVSDARPSYFKREFEGLRSTFEGKLNNHVNTGKIDEATPEDLKAIVNKWLHDSTTKDRPCPVVLPVKAGVEGDPSVPVESQPETNPLKIPMKCPENSPTYGDEFNLGYCQHACQWPEKATQCKPFMKTRGQDRDAAEGEELY